MTAPATLDTGRTLAGIGHALAGFSIFSMQDAIVKWLATSLPIWEILFFRSAVIILLILVAIGPRRVGAMAMAGNHGPLVMRGVMILCAWLAYFTASKSLHLSELVTIYFSTPIFVVIMSVFALKEHVGRARWLATLVGFAGVVIAAGPSGLADWVPVALTLFAAVCWAWTNILVRLFSRTGTTVHLMFVSSAMFLIVCGASLPFTWVTPDAVGLGLMIALGCVGGIGQYLLFEGYRLAPASAIAPFEYVTLIWAFVWGYVIWADVPALSVIAGASLIMLSGIGLILFERRAASRPAEA